jgi:hypothetical protein
MKIYRDSSWLSPMTPRQNQSISKLARILGIREYIEDTPANRYEARAMIYNLLTETRLRRAKCRSAKTASIGGGRARGKATAPSDNGPSHNGARQPMPVKTSRTNTL